MRMSELYHVKLEFDVETEYRTPAQIKTDLENSLSRSGVLLYNTKNYECTEIPQPSETETNKNTKLQSTK